MKAPLCERCHNEDATSISFFNIRPSASGNGDVIFACQCTAESEEYYITLDRIGERWLSHLRDKRWFTAAVEEQYRKRVETLGAAASEMLVLGCR